MSMLFVIKHTFFYSNSLEPRDLPFFQSRLFQSWCLCNMVSALHLKYLQYPRIPSWKCKEDADSDVNLGRKWEQDTCLSFIARTVFKGRAETRDEVIRERRKAMLNRARGALRGLPLSETWETVNTEPHWAALQSFPSTLFKDTPAFE